MLCVKCGYQNLTLANYCEKCGTKILRIGYSEQRFYGSLDIVNDDEAVGESRWDVLDSQIPLVLNDACEGILSGAMSLEEFVQVAEFQAELAGRKLHELQDMVFEKDEEREMEVNNCLIECFDACALAASLMLRFAEDQDPAVLDEARDLVEEAGSHLYTAKTTARKFRSLMESPQECSGEPPAAPPCPPPPEWE
jgi:hypothetical protein